MGDNDTGTAGREGGFTVAGALWVMGVTLILVTMFANLFVQRYAQAVIRQATDEGARAWAVSGGSQSDCELAAADVMGDLLGGSMGDGVSIRCTDTGPTISVVASGTMPSMPPLPPANISQTSVVTKELEEGLELP